MKRRNFVGLASTTLAMMPFMGFRSFEDILPSADLVKPDWLIKLIKMNDENLKGYSSSKITDPANKYFGAFYDGNLYITPGHVGGFLISACNAISTPESSYFKSTQLLKEMQDASQGLLALQHTDGTIDLLDTNFHSTPDTAFLIKELAPAFNRFKKTPMQGAEKTVSNLEKFLKLAGEALTVGGIHTPNHRWVVSAALMRVYQVFPDQRYFVRINQWLSEHIDLDPDGQYTEKSTGGYSGIVDRSLVTVAIGLKKPELLDPVRKNHNMMQYYLHPNGEVVTEASNRQDKGTIGNLDGYYYSLRYLSILDNNGEYANMCRMIEKRSFNALGGYLGYFLEDPMLWKDLPSDKPLKTNYAKAFPYSGVVRVRRNEWDCTILSSNPGWLTFHKEQVMLQAMRLASSFFGKGQFQSSEIKQEGNAWVLKSTLEGPYFQPFPSDQIPGDGDWDKMPKSKRKQSEVQILTTTVNISESGNGVQVDIDMQGTDHVPVALELIFRKGGTFAGVKEHPSKKDAYLFDQKEGSYTMNGQSIKFGPGQSAHRNVQLRGGLPSVDAPSVYITGFTPFKHTLFIS